MGNILCKKLTIMDREFDEKKTVKVSGISQLLRDQFAREFQTEKNSTGYKDDVNKLYICPDGEDCVLVEFTKDIPQDARVIGSTLKIGGTDLNVERWISQASTKGPSSRRVSAIWPTDGPPLPESSDEQVHPQNETTRSTPNGTDGKDRGNGKKLFGKDARHNEFANRRGLNSSPETTRGTPFNETTVKLDDDLVEKIQKEAEYKKILKEEEVNLDQKGYLTGTWNAIYGAGQKIISIISGSDQPGNSYDPANNFSFSSTNASNQSGGPTTATDQSPQSKEPEELFTVNPLFLRYIMAYHYEVFQKLQNVSKEISFEGKSKTEMDLKFFARKDVDKPTFSKAVDKFIDFVQARYPKMHEEVIPTLSKNKIDVISEARMKYSVVMDSEQERDKITIYGEKENVEKAKKFLNSKVGMSHPGSGSSKGTTAEVGVIEKLSFDLSGNLKLVVYQGDLTKENVDAIVNPANDRLQHGGGAAGAIVKAGGRIIQDESDDIMWKRGRRLLQPGEVELTGAGQLPCKFIVHAVGPIWSQHSPNTAMQLLYTAVYNSLCVACRNGARSISIPAIGSGLYKVPVDTCARVLFEAIVNFASNADKTSPLEEIHLVNIESSTNRKLVQEMEKRFPGSNSIKREKVEAILSKDTKERDRQTQIGQRQMAFTTTGPTNSDRDRTTSITHKGSSHNPHSGDNKDTGGRPSDDKPRLLSFAEAAGGKNPSTNDDPKPLKGKKTKDDECSICLSEFTKKKTLDKCGHSFCTKCIDKAFKMKKQCPICSRVYGPLKGNQPKGNMYASYQSTYLPGYGSCGSIVISYRFASGTQGPDHPNPGKPYMGTSRTAYLPDNKEGRKVLNLLRKAFEQKLTFTIGRSTTTGRDDCITWNDIHHKTSMTGGPTHFGYPDPDYLKRVQDELAAKGITE